MTLPLKNVSVRSMDVQTLATYIPQDQRRALAQGQHLPTQSQGAVLFADISGFTPLAEALVTTHGPRRGAEALSRHLNHIYDALIAQVDQAGGSVIGFAGDAITTWFDERDGESGLRAVACALAMQTALQQAINRPTDQGDPLTLAVKIAIVIGSVRRFLVGDPQHHHIDVLAGHLMARMAQAEQLAAKGEVVLDSQAAAQLAPYLELRGWRSDPQTGAQVAIVQSLPTYTPPPIPNPTAAPSIPALPPNLLRPWLLHPVYQRLQIGLGEFLTELRPVVALFLRFPGWDYDHDGTAGQQLDVYIRWVQGVVATYEGVLLDITIGDKGSYLYIAWGALTAHEDDALRAVTAALDLQTPPASIVLPTAVIIGISRGLMRTGAYGGTTRRTYGALGDSANLAARLMSYALPGEIIASNEVRAVTAAHFHWQPRPALQLKGKREPVTPFALLGRSSSTTSLASPLIGRQAELAHLMTALETTLATTTGQLIGLMGEAGVGKSRLLTEVSHGATHRGMVIYTGACYSYGISSPYLVWQPIWRAFFGLTAHQHLNEALPVLEAALTMLDPQLLPRLPLLGPLLDLPIPDNALTRAFDAPLRKSLREDLIVDCLKAGASRQPLLIILEDVHWIDPLSQALLEAIVNVVPSIPLLVLLSYRPMTAMLPGLTARATTADGMPPAALAESPISELHLQGLTPTEAEALITHRLQRWFESPSTHPTDDLQPRPPSLDEDISHQFKAHLIARTQGNPFYIEELLNYLNAQGINLADAPALARLEWPTSIQSLVLSRVDKLSERQQSIIKVASIIGRRFPLVWLAGYYPALGSPDELQAELTTLQQLDLTLPAHTDGELVYLFKHVMIQEVVYESLSYATRANLHEALASFLEHHSPVLDQRLLDVLAYHFERSDNLIQKRHYLRAAAEAAARVYANEAARDYYQRLVPLLTPGQDLAEIWLALGTILEVLGNWEEAQHACQEALTQAQQTSDAPWSSVVLAKAHQLLGRLLGKMGALDQAQAHLQRAHHYVAHVPDEHTQQTLLGELLIELGTIAWSRGDDQQAQSYLQEALTLASAADLPRIAALAISGLGRSAQRQGDYAASQRLLEASLVQCYALGDKPIMAYVHNLLGILFHREGEYTTAHHHHEAALKLYQEIGHKQGIASVQNCLGLGAYRQGHYELAQGLYSEALRLYRELGYRVGVAASLTNLALLAQQQRRYTQAQALHEESLKLKREMGDNHGIALTLGNLGLVSYSQSDYLKATQLLSESLTLKRKMGNKPSIAITVANLGYVALALNDFPLAQHHFTEGLHLAHTLGSKLFTANILVGVAAFLVAAAPTTASLICATHCLAASQALLAQTRSLLDPVEQDLHTRTLAMLQATLSPDTFRAAWTTGQTLPQDQVVALALQLFPLLLDPRSPVGNVEEDRPVHNF